MQEKTKIEIFRFLLLTWWLSLLWAFISGTAFGLLLWSVVIVTWVTIITINQMKAERFENGQEASEDRR